MLITWKIINLFKSTPIDEIINGTISKMIIHIKLIKICSERNLYINNVEISITKKWAKRTILYSFVVALIKKNIYWILINNEGRRSHILNS